MRPLIFVWPYALAFWAVFLWAFFPESRIVARRSEPSHTAQDKRSKLVIMVGQGVGVFLAFNASRLSPSAALPSPLIWFWLGIALIVCGRLLRRHTQRMLGASFTGAVIVREEQTIVERGAYRYVRHPSYSAGMLLFLGVGLAVGNWLGTLAVVVMSAATYIYRVRVEERALLATLGQPYADYMCRTKRFIPGLF